MLVLTNPWKGFLALALSAILLFNCTSDDGDGPENQETVKLATDPALGSYLTDATGKTLYFFTKDVAGASVCEGSCLAAWPVFFVEEINAPSGLNASDFATITRSDGTKQTTYKGWPLYYFAQDVKAGEIKGEDVNKVWYVAKPDYTIMIADTDVKFLTDISGKTLYYFTADATDVSNCTGGCLANWPEFNVDKIVAPSSVSKNDFKTITRSDGKQQISFKGKPLYYFVQDAQRGDQKGKGVGGKWFEASPE